MNIRLQVLKIPFHVPRGKFTQSRTAVSNPRKLFDTQAP